MRQPLEKMVLTNHVDDAAPELLAALELLVDRANDLIKRAHHMDSRLLSIHGAEAEFPIGEIDRCNLAIGAAKAAIAKARGE